VNCQIVRQLIIRIIKGGEKSMTIKFSELLTSKQIDALYLMTIRNKVRRQEMRKLIEELRLFDSKN
jgi:hypothetical protein